MPRGYAEVYSALSKMELFIRFEEMLNLHMFYIDHPYAHCIQVWNNDGTMIEVERDTISHCVESGMLITFWNATCNNISIEFGSNENGFTTSTLFLDGFDTKDIYAIFTLILSFIFSQNAYEIKGFVFDRKEITEGIDWDSLMKCGSNFARCVRKLPFEIASETRITEANKCTINSFQPSNVYVAQNMEDGITLFELRIPETPPL